MEKVHTPKRVAAQPGQRRKIALIAAGCAAAVLLAAYLGLCAWVGGSPNILKGVSVAGVPVGGLTREQALETLEDNLGQVSSVTLPLEYGPWGDHRRRRPGGRSGHGGSGLADRPEQFSAPGRILSVPSAGGGG